MHDAAATSYSTVRVLAHDRLFGVLRDLRAHLDLSRVDMELCQRLHKEVAAAARDAIWRTKDTMVLTVYDAVPLGDDDAV